MRLVSVIFLAIIPVIFVSCGIARSTSSIWKAEDQRENSLGKIVIAFEKENVVETDEFGRRSLTKKAADDVKPLEKRKAAYYFFKGDAYLSKAYDFRSKSIYDSSDFLAKKALEYFNEAAKIASAEEPVPATEVKPAPAPEVKPAPAPEVKPAPATEVKPAPAPEVKPAPATEVKPAPAPEVKPAPAPDVKPEPEPVVEPAPAPDAEEKPSLKGDPFAEKKEEPKKAEPEKKEEKKPSYYDVYEEMRQKYLKKQSEEKEKEKEEEKKEEQKKEKKKNDSTAPQGGAK